MNCMTPEAEASRVKTTEKFLVGSQQFKMLVVPISWQSRAVAGRKTAAKNKERQK